ncbi:MAG: hypothetical protein SFU53_16045 [Terrimicrobiaceae bacterium]|nr:hypothetical protein [Terrimicrobiaceae bacterium]
MFRCLSAVVAVALLAGCSIVREVNDGRYNRNNEAGDRWLSDQLEPAAINISGNWLSDDWGRGEFVQNGRRITGRLGDYDVRGVASGNQAYLLIASDEWYYYSAILQMPRPGLLTGRFSRMIPYVKTLSRPMRFEQLVH